jgi:hypothetical protein
VSNTISSVEELVALALGPTYLSELPLQVAEKVLGAHEVSPGVLRELALVGLAKRIADAHHMNRGRAGGPKEEPNNRHSHARRKEELERVNKKITAVISRHIRVLKDIALECDGRLKNLHAFDRSDIQHWISRSERHANGWAKRAAWFHSADSAIVKHKKATVSELPDLVLQKLAVTAEKAWTDAT